jgi:homoserine dehydrogenase
VTREEPRPLRIGLAGLGTVGAGLLHLLAHNHALIARSAGRPIVITAVSARDRARDRGTPIADLRWHDDPLALVTDPEVDVVVELIGGSGDPALALVCAALAAGKPVVTANKALLAIHGKDLAQRAAAAGVPLAYEAAVAGGIPVIKALREGLAANRIESISGILNGTCNYILTKMREGQGRDRPASFAEVLAEAQRLGYAEADPSTDIDGHDTAHKLAILAALAFGQPVDFDAVHIEGLRAIDALDIAYASELGYRIKLLGIARRTPSGIDARVHPTMLPENAPLAMVDGVYNAVLAIGDQVGRVLFEGRGAGAGPTASAVAADLIDIARFRVTPVWGHDGADQTPDLKPVSPAPISGHVGPYYLRVMVADQPGVIADITAALRDNGVSLEAMLQRGRNPAAAVPVVLVTHDTFERALRAAVAHISALPTVLEPPTVIRIEAS